MESSFVLVTIVALLLCCIHSTEQQQYYVGGQQSEDTDKEEVQDAAKWFASRISTISGYSCTLISVVDCKSQVVSGYMYRMTMNMYCIIDGTNEECQCFAKVTDQAWMKPQYKLYENNCTGRLSQFDKVYN